MSEPMIRIVDENSHEVTAPEDNMKEELAMPERTFVKDFEQELVKRFGMSVLTLNFQMTGIFEDLDLIRLDTLEESIKPPSEMPRLTESQRAMALSHRQSKDKTTFAPLLYFALASAGEIIMGFGAGKTVQGRYSVKTDHQAIMTGIVLIVTGALGVILSTLGFGSAFARFYPAKGWATKGLSILATFAMTSGDAIVQYYEIKSRSLLAIRISFVPLAMGVASMAVTLPNFIAYTELRLGRVALVPRSKRGVFGLACFSCSSGILFGGLFIGEPVHWPLAVHISALTFAISIGFIGPALNWSEHIRRRAIAYDERLIYEEGLGFDDNRIHGKDVLLDTDQTVIARSP